jgi:hypothetical protein
MCVVLSFQLPLDNYSFVDGGSRVRSTVVPNVPSTFLSEETSELPHLSFLDWTTLTRKL